MGPRSVDVIYNQTALGQRCFIDISALVQRRLYIVLTLDYICTMQGRIQDFKLGGAHLKKLRRAEEGANILGVFRVKNHYFTPKNHSFYNYRGRREKFWGISCEKSRFYAKKTFFFPILGGRAPGAPPPPPLDPPLQCMYNYSYTRCGIRLTLYQRPDSPTNILRKETAMSINSTSNTFDHNFHYDEHSIISIRSTSSSVKPVHASTPINKRNAHSKSNLPLRVLNINLQSIKRKQHLVNNIISKVQNQIL